MKKLFLITLIFSFNTYAAINLDGTDAQLVWKQIANIGTIENVEIIQQENNQQVIHIDHLACVFEMYNACSFFIPKPNERKMVVATEGTAALMNQLAKVGVIVDEENSSLYVNSINCQVNANGTNCEISE